MDTKLQAKATSEIAAERAVSSSDTQSLLTGVSANMVRSGRTPPAGLRFGVVAGARTCKPPNPWLHDKRAACI